MKVKDAQFFAVVSSFLNVYLVKNRSCSSNTVKSYECFLLGIHTVRKVCGGYQPATAGF